MRRILLIQDDRTIRHVLRGALENTGHAVVVTRTPAEALEVARSVCPGSIDAIVGDIDTPGTQEALPQLRRVAPVVLLSPSSHPVASAPLLARVLPLPFTMPQLVRAIHDATEGVYA